LPQEDSERQLCEKNFS